MPNDPNPMPNPEENSEFARSKQLAADKGTAPGVDPKTGERASITYRQIYNETGGDENRTRQIWNDLKAAGGYGNVDQDQTLDLRSLSRSVNEYKDAAERGVDLKGRPLDLFGKRKMEQQAQHQDNLVNAVGEVLERLKKG